MLIWKWWVKIFVMAVKKRVLLLMSFKVHMHSLGVLTHPALDVTGLGPLTAEAAICWWI